MGIYVNYDGIAGEATQQDHKKWIDVLSLSWGVGRGISQVGDNYHQRDPLEPSISEATIIKNFDAASPKLFTEAAAGNAGKEVKIDLTTTGNPSVTYCTYTLTNALISSYSVSTSGDRPTESVSISFTKLEFKFTPYDDKNKDGAPTTVTYDLATTKSSALAVSNVDEPITNVAMVKASYEDSAHKIAAIIGSAGFDYSDGTIADEVMNGLLGNDTFLGRGGNDSINGGEGIDTALYQGKRAEFDVSAVRNVNIPNQLGQDLPQEFLKFVDMSLFATTNGEVRTVTDKVSGRSGIDTLSGIERIQFMDGTLLTHVAKTEANTTLYKLYQASFGRSPDEKGFLGWVNQIKSGLEPQQITNNFLNSTEFAQKFGDNTQSNAAFVDYLYHTALGREGDADGVKAWVAALQYGQLSRAEVLLAFATSQEANMKIAGNVENGYWLL